MDYQHRAGPIRVSSKTLGLISSGIYRSPASAMKELVSNAYDADAGVVRISMNPPSFDVVSVTDNGSGMTYDKFIRLMELQIGSSDKRRGGRYTAVRRRPIIGRIGIGLLAVAQICHGFEVISHHTESRTAFRARVMIQDYLEEELDSQEYDDRHDIGQFMVEQIPFDGESAGTSIIATELKRGFLSRMRENTLQLPSTFDDFFSQVIKHDSIRDLSSYWRIVWGISVAAPIPYYDGGPTRDVAFDEIVNQKLIVLDFRLVLDGLSLNRPIVLPPRVSEIRSSADTRIVRLSIDRVIDGSRLSGEGYIYSQGGKSIYPAELRGMLIRIKGVAVGDYDKNFLDYPVVEGPRFGWLSGEIDVAEGLEDALNIDRDSFNEAHPHYLAIVPAQYGGVRRQRGWALPGRRRAGGRGRPVPVADRRG